jgi:hypothetical protein
VQYWQGRRSCAPLPRTAARASRSGSPRTWCGCHPCSGCGPRRRRLVGLVLRELVACQGTSASRCRGRACMGSSTGRWVGCGRARSGASAACAARCSTRRSYRSSRTPIARGSATPLSHPRDVAAIMYEARTGRVPVRVPGTVRRVRLGRHVAGHVPDRAANPGWDPRPRVHRHDRRRRREAGVPPVRRRRPAARGPAARGRDLGALHLRRHGRARSGDRDPRRRRAADRDADRRAREHSTPASTHRGARGPPRHGCRPVG